MATRSPYRENGAPLLLDASRLVWRRWAGTRATGIDRICQAWLVHYGPRAQAVITHRKGQTILPYSTSQRLFRLLGTPETGRDALPRFRAALSAMLLTRGLHLRDRLAGDGRFWLNPGHTGLDAPGVAGWCARRGVRPVYLIHDLIPLTHPQYCREGEDERHRKRMKTALATGHAIVANSAHTLETLEAFARAEGQAMPPAVVAWPGTPQLPVPDRPIAGGGAARFVVLGTIEGRKNHTLLLEVWQAMLAAGDRAPPELVIVGRRGWQADAVFALLDRSDFRGTVREVGALDDARLAALLADARALLFPSFAEGYGIPLVEALAAGVPVIASDLPVFREIGQGVPELLSPADAPAWREAILDYASADSARRGSQLQRLAGFRVPDWESHFARVDAFLAGMPPR